MIRKERAWYPTPADGLPFCQQSFDHHVCKLSWDEAMNLTINIPDHQKPVLIAKALEQGVSAEQYAQQVLQHDLAAAPIKPHQSLSEVFQEIWADMPEDARANLPRDGASQVDHYVYGLPKRDL